MFYNEESLDKTIVMSGGRYELYIRNHLLWRAWRSGSLYETLQGTDSMFIIAHRDVSNWRIYKL